MTDYYFAYGSNMNPVRVQKRKMQFQDVLGEVLRDYRLSFNKKSVKFPGSASANVMVAPGETTEGVLYQLSAPEQIEMMDPFEGYPIRYDRKSLPIDTERGELYAWVYIANPDYIEEGLSPNRWYLNHLLAGERFLSAGYFDVLREIPCLPDSDSEPT